MTDACQPYDAPGVAPSYRASRALPAETARQLPALPLRSGTAEVVLLSMVDHQLADRPAAIADLRRVLRRGGRVLVRTPTHETLDRFAWLRFFPEALAFDRERVPTEVALVAAFADAGFRLRDHQVISQRIASGLGAYIERIRGRAFSSLQAIPDDAWRRGLAALEAHCPSAPDGPVEEPVNLFVFE